MLEQDRKLAIAIAKGLNLQMQKGSTILYRMAKVY